MIKYSVIRRGVNIEKNIRFWNQTDLNLNCKLETYQLCERQVDLLFYISVVYSIKWDNNIY